MKKIICVTAIAAVFAACGNSSPDTTNTDSAAKAGTDTTMHTDSGSMMMPDTTHKDTTHK